VFAGLTDGQRKKVVAALIHKLFVDSP